MRWLYHVTPAIEVIAGQAFAPPSLARDGFIHASWKDAVLESARLHTDAHTHRVVLAIDPRRVAVPIEVATTPQRGQMPHIAGPIPADAVRRVTDLVEWERGFADVPDTTSATRFGFVVFPGMTLLDLVGVLDPLSRLASMGYDLDSTCTLVGVNEEPAWTGAGATLKVNRVRGPLDDFDVLVVPGGPGTRSLADAPDVAAWLGTFPHNRIIASVCSGALLLGAAGRLRGRRATSHARVIDRLPAYGATPVRERVVDEGTVVTAGGVTSALDLGIHLVRRLYDPETAARIAGQMEMR
jgi:cyclohexyl-isocyanide hydratase